MKLPDPEAAAAEAVLQELLAEDKPRVHQLDLVDPLRRREGSTQAARVQMATETLLRMDGAARLARLNAARTADANRRRGEKPDFVARRAAAQADFAEMRAQGTIRRDVVSAIAKQYDVTIGTARDWLTGLP